MSKFEEICLSYAIAEKEFQGYTKNCKKFLYDLTSRLVAYYDCPKENLQILPIEHEASSSPSIFTLEEDLFWHFTWVFTIYKHAEELPHQHIQLKLRLKQRRDATYIVYCEGIQKEFIIGTNQESTYIEFFDAVYNRLITLFSNEIQSILKNMLAKKLVLPI